MATFSKLPNELIGEIGSFVLEPQDVESFALVSKRFHQLSLPFVEEHALLRKLFSGVRIAPGCNDGRSAELFGQMFQDPRVKYYIQDLENEGKWARHWDSPRYSEPLMVTIANLQDAIQEFARFLGNMPRQRSLSGVDRGEEGPFLACQFMRLIGWTELISSDFPREHRDLFRKLEHLLFPSGQIPLPVAGNYWAHATMSVVFF